MLFFVGAALLGSVAGKDGELHSIEADAISLFDARTRQTAMGYVVVVPAGCINRSTQRQ
jgi:hypothetical protein